MRGVTPLRRQRGVALLVAILLVALGTIIAAAMAYNNAMTARRAAATFGFDQALLVAQGAEALAAYALQFQVHQNAPYIAPGQAWDPPPRRMEVVPGVTLEASMEDLQGRFNVNNLVTSDGTTANPTAIEVFQRLLTLLNLDPKFANYLVDWIDKNTTPMIPDGAEDSVYMELDPPYRTANLPITSTTELMALPGFTRADFNKLSPYIVALPTGTDGAAQINLCSAPAVLLDALAGTVQFSADPKQLQQLRAQDGCFPTQAVFQATVGQKWQTLSGLVSQTSHWFRLTSFIDAGSAEFSVYTLLYLDGTGTVRPVMRSFTPN